MTIAVELDGSNVAVLRTEAAELGIPVEQFAATIIGRHLATRSSAANDDAIRKAADATFRENDALYRRLAK